MDSQNKKITTIPQQVLLILTLAVALNIARVFIFHSLYFVYLLWNIFLAILPFLISYILLWRNAAGKLSNTIFILFGIVWLLFLPNAPYIVTDLIHMGRGHGVPLLFDTFLLFSSAWIGIILCVQSILHIDTIIISKYGLRVSKIIIPLIIFLTSVGVYIGRYLRFNSWDIFADQSFFGDTIGNLSHPVHFNEALLFISVCFVFIYMAYNAQRNS